MFPRETPSGHHTKTLFCLTLALLYCSFFSTVLCYQWCEWAKSSENPIYPAEELLHLLETGGAQKAKDGRNEFGFLGGCREMTT